MKVTTDRPVVVTPPVTTVTIELTLAEAQLLALDVWGGPNAHASSYFGDRAKPGAIVGNVQDVHQGVQLRDLLRLIAIMLKKEGVRADVR